MGSNSSTNQTILNLTNNASSSSQLNQLTQLLGNGQNNNRSLGQSNNIIINNKGSNSRKSNIFSSNGNFQGSNRIISQNNKNNNLLARNVITSSSSKNHVFLQGSNVKRGDQLINIQGNKGNSLNFSGLSQQNLKLLNLNPSQFTNTPNQANDFISQNLFTVPQ